MVNLEGELTSPFQGSPLLAASPSRTRKKKARYYLGETSQSQVTFSLNPELGAPEHHEYRWLPYEEVKKLAPERLLPIIEWAQALLRNT